ncbi:MAG: hypothetical protein LRZ97_00105 [Candidatus Pacebacteria bacterium]|nr:hypothetical protein [Candidatus Paceibacterota bacterium]
MPKLLIVSMVVVFGIVTPVFAQYQSVPNHQAGPLIPPTVYINRDAELQSKCTDCTFVAYRLVKQLNCGAVVALEDIINDKPTCMLVPRVTYNGAVMLEWDTNKATVAFIDSGVGHVSTGHGTRTITPQSDITYNMTIVSESGVVGHCSAKVDVFTKRDELESLTSVDATGLNANTTIKVEDPATLEDSWFNNFAIKVFFIILLILAISIAFIYIVFRKVKKRAEQHVEKTADTHV